MEDKVYQHKDIVRIFPDLSPRSLVSWSEKDILTPSGGDAAGRGTVRKYLFDDIVQAGIIRELMLMGFTFRDIKMHLSEHWKNQIRKFEYNCIVSFQRNLYYVSNTSELATRIDTRVFSWQEYKELGANALHNLSSIDRNTGKLVSVGQSSEISSFLMVDVNRIHRHIVFMLS